MSSAARSDEAYFAAVHGGRGGPRFHHLFESVRIILLVGASRPAMSPTARRRVTNASAKLRSGSATVEQRECFAISSRTASVPSVDSPSATMTSKFFESLLFNDSSAPRIKRKAFLMTTKGDVGTAQGYQSPMDRCDGGKRNISRAKIDYREALRY